MLIDTHAHLYLDHFNEDIDNTIQRCRENGITRIFLPNIDVASIMPLARLCSKFPDVCMPQLGLHPCDVKADYIEVLNQIKDYIDHKLDIFPENKIYAIGETGLDYYWDKTFIEAQKAALRIQIGWAKNMNLPIVLHTRDSFEDTWELVKQEKNEGLKAVFHCFTGNVEQAKMVMSLGENFFMGIGGPVTYKNSGLPQVLENISLDHIVLETDSPYLPPVPYRGKRNESSYVKLVAEKIAEIKNISFEEVSAITTANAKRLYGLN